MGRAGESNGGDMGTTVVNNNKKQNKKKAKWRVTKNMEIIQATSLFWIYAVMARN